MRIANIEVPVGDSVSDETIATALSYIDKSEIRVRSVSIDGQEYASLLSCHSPTYTKKPVEYISTSELAISSAQVAHVVLELLVASPSFPYKHLLDTRRLSALRDNHEIYFLNWQVRFRRISKRTEYVMNLTVDRVLTKRNSIFAQCSFRVGTAIRGSFTALMPGENGGGEIDLHN